MSAHFPSATTGLLRHLLSLVKVEHTPKDHVWTQGEAQGCDRVGTVAFMNAVPSPLYKGDT